MKLLSVVIFLSVGSTAWAGSSWDAMIAQQRGSFTQQVQQQQQAQHLIDQERQRNEARTRQQTGASTAGMPK